MFDSTLAPDSSIDDTFRTRSRKVPTAAEIIVLIGGWSDLPKPRRGALIASLRATARIAKVDAAMLYLSPADLNKNLLGEVSQLHGISATSMATILSNLRYVMRRVGLLPLCHKLSSPWAELRARLPARGSVTLTRFSQFHSRAGILPDAVSDRSFADFQRWVEQNTLCRNPSRLFAQTRYVWNRAANQAPEAHLPILGAARCRVLRTIAIADMQPALQADLARFQVNLSSSDLDDPFEPDFGGNPGNDKPRLFAPRRPLRKSTVEERVRHARQALWVLVQTGRSLETITGLKDLVVPIDNAKAIIRYMWEQAGKRPSTSAGHLAEVLRQIAKYFVGLPESNIAQIANWKRTALVKYGSMTAKNSRRVEALLAPEAAQKFLALPKVLMDQAVQLLPVSPQLAVSAAKRALLIHLGIFYPLRISNTVGLRADRHFIHENGNTGPIIRFMIPSEETKNREPINMPVLRLTSDLITLWNRKFRPLIADSCNPFVFPGVGGRSMTRQAAGASLKKVIAERVGCEVNPHLFRHRAAVDFLIKNPGEFEVVRLLLGHKSAETARRSYIGPERDAAFKRFDESVLEGTRLLRRAIQPRYRLSGQRNAAQKMAAKKSDPEILPTRRAPLKRNEK